MLFYLNAVENTSLGNDFLFTSPVNSCKQFKQKRDYLFN